MIGEPDEYNKTVSLVTVYGLFKYDHIGNCLQNLHWLPVKYRIVYKILMLAYKCLNGLAPKYLSEMIYFVNYCHVVKLYEPASLTSFGVRAFSRAAPKLWNDLPLELKECSSLASFKSKLKTHLFLEAFN